MPQSTQLTFILLFSSDIEGLTLAASENHLNTNFPIVFPDLKQTQKHRAKVRLGIMSLV